MKEGFFYLHRQIIDSDIFAHQTGLKIWIWCLAKANHKKKTIPLQIGRGFTSVTCNKGQFVFGRYKAEEELNIDGSTVYKWMQKMKDMNMIDIDSNNQYSIITICNWSTYQFDINKKEQPNNNQVTTKEQQKSSSVTAEEQQRNTTNNDNNVNNIIYNKFYDDELLKTNDEKYIHFVKFIFGNNPTKEPFENILRIEKQLKYDEFKVLVNLAQAKSIKLLDKIYELENYVPKKPYKSIYLTLHNWIRR